MRIISALSGKIALLSVAAFLLALPALSQNSLRKAMDYDHDNHADFAIFRPSNNVWYVNRSSDGGLIATQFGLAAEDYMTPGDYDGDGIGDIAVWRDSNGAWYRFNSSTGAFVAISFGVTGDEPVGRDFDGDGKTDLAIIRRSNGAMIW